MSYWNLHYVKKGIIMRFCFITTDSCQIKDEEVVDNLTFSFHPTSALYCRWKAKNISLDNIKILYSVPNRVSAFSYTYS